MSLIYLRYQRQMWMRRSPTYFDSFRWHMLRQGCRIPGSGGAQAPPVFRTLSQQQQQLRHHIINRKTVFVGRKQRLFNCFTWLTFLMKLYMFWPKFDLFWSINPPTFWPRDSSRGHRLYIVSQKTKLPTFSFVIYCVTVWFHCILSQITWLNHFVTYYLTYVFILSQNAWQRIHESSVSQINLYPVILSKSIHFFIQFRKKSRGLEYESIFGLVISKL